jgi:hypothetical protein
VFNSCLRNIATEEFEFYEKYDTVLMINGLENGWNAFSALEAVYRFVGSKNNNILEP